MSRRARAEALLGEIRDALTDADLADVLVTMDPSSTYGGYSTGLVIVMPPRLAFTSWGETEETTTLHVAAGPFDDILTAWDRLDLIIDALRAAHINLASGEPQPLIVSPGEPPLPGYEFELTPAPVTDTEI